MQSQIKLKQFQNIFPRVNPTSLILTEIAYICIQINGINEYGIIFAFALINLFFSLKFSSIIHVGPAKINNAAIIANILLDGISLIINIFIKYTYMIISAINTIGNIMLQINNCIGFNMSFFTFSKLNISAGKTKHPKNIISHFKYKSDSIFLNNNVDAINTINNMPICNTDTAIPNTTLLLKTFAIYFANVTPRILNNFIHCTQE